MKKVISDINQAAEVLKANNIALYTFDHSAFYDTDSGRRNWEDFKSENKDNALFFSGRNGLDYLVFFENEEIKNKPYFKISHLRKMKKADLYALCEKLDSYGLYDDFDETKQTLIDRLMNITNEDYYNNLYENEYYNELDYDFSVTGYSQGDLFKVKLVGKTEKHVNADYLQNLVYDTPVYMNVNVYLNGEALEDFLIFEHSNFDEYAYFEKEDVIKMYSELTNDKEYHELLIEYLKENLASALDYL